MEESAIRDVFAERLVDRGFSEETASLVAAQLKPCVLLKLRYGWRPWGTRRGASRFGGWPEVPVDFVWPLSQYHERWGLRPNGERYQTREEGGSPLAFIAQLNLAEIRPLLPEPDLLPGSGLLSLFFDRREMPLGDDPDDPTGWRVFHFPDVAQLKPRQAPAAGSDALKLCPITARRWASLPSDLGPFIDTEIGDRELAGLLEEAQRLDLDGSAYRMFGHAGTIQQAMEPEAERIRRNFTGETFARLSSTETATFEADARRAWRLLIQFPTDYRAKVDWCEAGTLFVWMHDDDLAARRFDKAWMTWQVA